MAKLPVHFGRQILMALMVNIQNINAMIVEDFIVGHVIQQFHLNIVQQMYFKKTKK
jgi:hypothetical protein